MTQQESISGSDKQFGKYIYGLIPDPETLDMDCPAINSSIDSIHTVSWNGIAAVTSSTDSVDIRPTRRNMIAHARVLESLLNQHTVLPVRFGTIAQSEGDIRSILEAHASEVSRLFGAFEDKVEFGLTVGWDRDAVLKDVLDTSEALRRLRDELAARPAAKTYYQRIDFGSKLEAAMIARRDALAEDIIDRFRALAGDIHTEAVTSDTDVLSAAFLIEKADEQDFDSLLAEAETAFGSLLSWKCVGPSPAYSFIRLNIPWQKD